MKKFTKLSQAEPFDVLQKHWQSNSFRGLQAEVIDCLVEQKNHALVIMPTGAGKSLCFQIPALLFPRGTLVLSPLIALMQDQVAALTQKGIAASFINSTVEKNQRDSRLQAFLSGAIKLLYVTPERFRKPEFVEKIKAASPSLLVVDEAHCISEWGHDFRPDYSRIGEFRKMLGEPLTVALTATATPTVQKDIIAKLELPPDSATIFHQGIERPNLRLEVTTVDLLEQKYERAFGFIQDYRGTATILYFSLIKNLIAFSEFLESKKISHLMYHGKLEARDRKKVQTRFMESASTLMLATNAFGMGIDKEDIRLIVHMDLPSSLEAYYQEIGRAGRDDLPSRCHLIYFEEDLATQLQFVKWANPAADYYIRLHGLLKENAARANGLGLDFLREQLSFKDKSDFRLETALAMLDRYVVTYGSLLDGNLQIVGDLPSRLKSDLEIENKRKADHLKLLEIVNYIKTADCRRMLIDRYFGMDGSVACGNCDRCAM